MNKASLFPKPIVVSRRLMLGAALSTILVGGFVYKAFAGTAKKTILFICDPRWVSQAMVDRMIHYAGGPERLREFGFTTTSLAISLGDADGLNASIRLAGEISPSILVVVGDDEVLAMHKAFPQTPLVFWCNADPTSTGLVTSFRLPGGIATGATSDWAENVKPLEFLSDVIDRSVPVQRKLIGIFCNGDWFSDSRRTAWLAAAESLSFALEFVAAETYSELLVSSAWNAVQRYDAVIMPISTASVTDGANVVRHLQNRRVLSLFENFTALTLGAPLGYEHIRIDWQAQLGQTLGLIVQGVPPGGIPVRGPEGWEYAINKSALANFGVNLSPITSARIGRVF
jgi:ABC-type uncharacterized transport system substrate-binding protein